MSASDKMQERIDELEDALRDLLNNCINFDDGKLFDCSIEKASKALRIKPPDLVPLECWINYYGFDRQPFAYLNKMQAKAALSQGGRTIHMREVMPQDEQDRKRVI